MLTQSFRPLLRAAARQTVRHASSSSRKASMVPSRLAVLAGTTVVVGALAVNLESRRLWNDDKKPVFNDDLKVNRHQVALEAGGTPETPLHNSETSSKSVPVPDGSSKQESSKENKEAAPFDPAATEEEAAQEGAFNEETGEINWDCPCLGGMAHGSCGEQFREAFSCFVFSEQEPKGIDCVDKFKRMQDCFREHPEEYGEEIDDDDEPETPNSPLTEPVEVKVSTPPASSDVPKAPVSEPPANSPVPKQTQQNNPAKGVEKIQPRKDRADKPAGAPSGDGTA